MKIPLYDIVTVYENILKDINIAQASMIIFTALDVDSLCALKILSKFLRQLNIEYTFHPVTSYFDLQNKIEECKGNQKIKLFFFINCGGLIDLTLKWFAKTAQIFLFDSNKPIHHANVQAPNIKIIDDDLGELDKAPTNKQVQMYQNFDEILQQLQQKQQRQESDSDQLQQIVAPKRKRHRSSQQAIQKLQKTRKLKHTLTQKVQSYYQNQFFSLPSSYITYKLIKQLDKSNNVYLWYAMVGLVSMFIEQKIQKEQFQKIIQLYRINMTKINVDNNNKMDKNSLCGRLDFMFPLFRHWSLYDSIMNSWYMIAGLNLWNDNGIKKLYELINLVGLSLQQSKQLYKYMLKSSTQKIQNELMLQASQPKFKLSQIAYRSFSKQIDYAFQMSASDFYYILATVLERPMKKVTIGETYDEEVRQHRIGCFLVAYEMFGWGQSKLEGVIEQSKGILKIYTKQAMNILQRNNIMNAQNLTVINLQNDTEDRRILEHPNSLTKFAYTLMFLNKQKYRYKLYKPLILSLTNNVTQRSKIVGIMNETKNNYSSKFNLAIEKLGVQAGFDCFMNNVVNLPKSAIVGFVREVGQI